MHLHVHTEYSLLDGLSKISDLVSYAKKQGMPALAISDHGAMYGVIEFYKECQAAEIKPILGMEAYTVPGDHRKKESKSDRENNHLLLLAKNKTGYKNLMKISTIAHLEGYYYRPRVSRELIKEYSEGLICTSACAKGEIAQALIDGKYEKAIETARWFQEVFGEDYYLELQRHNHKDFIDQAKEQAIKDELLRQAEAEKAINEGVVKISRQLGIPLVATNDAHYIKQEDAVAQDVLVCVATGKNVSDIQRLRFVDSPTFYLTTQDEMEQLFADYPEALENTLKIADKCNIDIKLGDWHFPKLDLPEGKTSEEHLRELADKLAPERVSRMSQEVKDRLAFELDVICGKGYAPYFLLMADLARFAEENNIITNTRGSAAGSIVSYVLGITTVDPLKYQLPFERFLNPDRPLPPDIDLDIADDKRELLIDHIVKKYGEDRVAQICTFGRMLARASVRDVARVLGYSYAIGDRIAKQIPLGSQGFPMTIEKALEINPELASMYKTDPDAKRILDLAIQVEGNVRHVSVHAAGVVISPSEMTSFTPLQKDPSQDKIITQYEMHACEDVGLIKVDLLGIRNLSILGSSIELVRQVRGEEIDIGKIPLDDEKTFEMLARGETMGVFQLAGSGMTRYLKELKPTRVEDLMVMVALFRPGPMANLPSYIRRKHGEELVRYPHPKLKKVLEKSYGVITYQEDVMLIAIEIAGYSWRTVDALRKAIGKKLPKEMAQQEKIFKEGAMRHGGLTKEEADRLWNLFTPFQGYGFNKAHAASYGIVAYQTAYMKANYPVEYMCALLSAEVNDTDKIAAAVAEARRMGILVLPPDINKSENGFTLELSEKSRDGLAIRFGLSAIKNVGAAAVEPILEARKEGEFSSLTDFVQRVDARKVNKKTLESLIKAGAMDSFGARSALLSVLDDVRSKAAGKQLRETAGQAGLFDVFDKKEQNHSAPVDVLPEITEFPQEELLSMERQLLGFYLSEHPLAGMLSQVVDRVTHKIFELSAEEYVGQNVRLACVVVDSRIVVTKNGNREMAFVRLEDDSGSVEAVVFPGTYSETRSYWSLTEPLIIEGKVEHREEALSIIVNQVRTIKEELDTGGKSSLQRGKGGDGASEQGVHTIRIPKGTSSKTLVRLNDLLHSNKGAEKVVLVIENGVAEKTIPLSFGVLWSQGLESKIKELLRSESS